MELRERIDKCLQEMRNHLFNELLPFWTTHGVDEQYGGFLTYLDKNGNPIFLLAMDNADLAKLLSDVQSTALRKWVYELPGNKGTGLTVHAVQDITQRMNWTGKAKIGVMAETLTTERIVENAGNGPEPFWVATIFARDEVTGAVLPGSSMEPVNMKLRKQTADKKRAEGAVIPDDNRVFDPFSRTKAIQNSTVRDASVHRYAAATPSSRLANTSAAPV